MAYYAGLDVSLEQTSVCVLDAAGAVVLERRVATDPAPIAACLAALPAAPARLLLETGGLTPWLWHELSGRGLVVHCIDARRAKAQLALRPAKTDRNDARGLAEIARMGWYANVRVKSLDHHALRAKLAARAQLVATARDLGNQLRGLLRAFGLRVGKGARGEPSSSASWPWWRTVRHSSRWPTGSWRRGARCASRSSVWTACCCGRRDETPPAGG
jgi:transposase